MYSQRIHASSTGTRLRFMLGYRVSVIRNTSIRSGVRLRAVLLYCDSLTQNLEHKITGDVLCMLDPEGLKSLGISSVGQRLCILKRVYLLKLAQDIPIDPEHYVPPCRLPFFSFVPALCLLIPYPGSSEQGTSSTESNARRIAWHRRRPRSAPKLFLCRGDLTLSYQVYVSSPLRRKTRNSRTP